MMDFLAHTLQGKTPAQPSGENACLRWQWWAEGIMIFTPRWATDKALIVSAGIHGNETAPIELLASLVADLLAGKIALQWRLMVIFGNPAALRAGKRYLHSDMNRMFGGRWQRLPQSVETRRARQLEQVLERFLAGGATSLRWHLDMHTALRDSYYPRFGVLPARTQPYDEAFLHWLGCAGLQALVFHQQPGGTFSHFSSEYFSALSCTLELGKARPLGHNELSQFAAADKALRALLNGTDAPAAETRPVRYQVVQQITRLSAGFVLHMAPQTLNFTAFPQGTLLAEDGARRYVVNEEQELVLFPNPGVALGLRAGLMLKAL